MTEKKVEKQVAEIEEEGKTRIAAAKERMEAELAKINQEGEAQKKALKERLDMEIGDLQNKIDARIVGTEEDGIEGLESIAKSNKRPIDTDSEPILAKRGRLGEIDFSLFRYFATN